MLPRVPRHGRSEPELHARIARRILINSGVDPAVARDMVPTPLRSQLVDGSAVAGICLIRLERLRPEWAPPPIEAVSSFFSTGDIAWSPTADPEVLEGLRREAPTGNLTAADPIEAATSPFDDLAPGSAVLDSVDVMRDVPVTWHAAGHLHVERSVTVCARAARELDLAGAQPA